MKRVTQILMGVLMLSAAAFVGCEDNGTTNDDLNGTGDGTATPVAPAN